MTFSDGYGRKSPNLERVANRCGILASPIVQDDGDPPPKPCLTGDWVMGVPAPTRGFDVGDRRDFRGALDGQDVGTSITRHIRDAQGIQLGRGRVGHGIGEALPFLVALLPYVPALVSSPML